MITNQNSTDINSDDIDKEIIEVLKDTPEFVENHLESIKNLLTQPQHLRSYPIIRVLLDDEKGFDELKVLLQFEIDQAHLKADPTRHTHDLDVQKITKATNTLRDLFMKNNDQIAEIQKNITEVEKSIKEQITQSAQQKKELKDSAKELLPIKVLRILFTRILNKVLKKAETEQLRKTEKELNNLKDQIHKMIDPLNKELNQLMNVYEQSIKKDHIYATIEDLYDVPKSPGVSQNETEAGYLDMRVGKPQAVSTEESIYVDADDYSPTQPKQAIEYNTVISTKYIQTTEVKKPVAQHAKIHESPKPQRAEIKQKPEVAPKPSRENTSIQKKVAPLVAPRRSSIGAVERICNSFEHKNTNDSTANKFSNLRNNFEKPKEVSGNVKKVTQAQNLREELRSLKSDGTEGLVKKFDNNKQAKPGKLNYRESFLKNLGQIVRSPETSPNSPTLTKKPFDNVVANQSKASKMKEIIQRIAPPSINGMPPPPPPIAGLANFKQKLAPSPIDNKATAPPEVKKITISRENSPERTNMMEDLKKTLKAKKEASDQKNKDGLKTRLTGPKSTEVSRRGI